VIYESTSSNARYIILKVNYTRGENDVLMHCIVQAVNLIVFFT
jgi:hypothetical protein